MSGSPAQDKGEDLKTGMSSTELRNTLIMCGKCSSGDETCLPAWIQYCALKGTSEAYKQTIIRKWSMNTFHYDDADVPLTTPLLKVIQK